MPGLADDLLAKARAWAERSCLDQQLPAKITDPAALDDIAAILHAQTPELGASAAGGGGAGGGGRPGRGG